MKALRIIGIIVNYLNHLIIAGQLLPNSFPVEINVLTLDGIRYGTDDG